MSLGVRGGFFRDEVVAAGDGDDSGEAVRELSAKFADRLRDVTDGEYAPTCEHALRILAGET